MAISFDTTYAGSTELDGTNDWAGVTAPGLTGQADGKLGTLMFFIKFDAAMDTTSRTVFFNSNGGVELIRGVSNKYLLTLRSSAGAGRWQAQSTNEWTSADGLHVFAASWDLSAGATHLYIGDADEETQLLAPVNGAVDYTKDEWAVGSRLGTVNSYVDGCIGPFYWNQAEYVDLTSETNRRKYVTAAGDPAFLGVDGSLLTGTQPIVFLDGHYLTFQDNKGSGGGFTENGEFAECAGEGSIYTADSATFVEDGNLSWAAWVNLPASIARGYIVIVEGGVAELEVNNTLLSLEVRGSTGAWDLRYVHEYSNGQNEEVIFDTNLANDTWYHIAIVRDDTAKTVKLYKDLTLVSTFTYTNSPTTTDTVLPLYYGSRNPTGEGLVGRIAEAVLAARVWTTDELNASKYLPSSLVHVIHRMNLIGRTTAATVNADIRDSSGQQIHGQMIAGTQLPYDHPNVPQRD